jgi:redox-sensitive bicupin YhaK (pirin superfamily)
VHSEFNHSKTEPVHFLQIWIQPDEVGAPAGYEEKHFDVASKTGRLRVVASKDGREGSVSIRQDASIYAAILNGSDAVSFPLQQGRIAYVHVARGALNVNGLALEAGDAVRIDAEAQVTLDGAVDAEVLLFDLPQ